MPRVLIIVFVLSLYCIAYYQDQKTSAVWNPGDKNVSHATHDPSVRNQGPYYEEFFVNDETPGTIHHVSSIAETDAGTLICTWYAGSREGAKDVSIYSSFFKEGAGIWTEEKLLADRTTSSQELNRYIRKIGNALVYNDLHGHLWLFYSTVTIGGWSGTSLNYKVSSDNGLTWSAGKRLYLSPFFNLTNNVKNKGISFEDGSFIVPTYHEFVNNFSQLIFISPKVRTLDYRIRRITQNQSAIQPSLVYLGNTTVIAFFRNFGSRERKKFILTALSRDMGRSWSDLSDTSLPNPNSGFDMLPVDGDGILGVINNSFDDRGILELIFSNDDGKTWKSLKVLENASGKQYSYPSIIRTRKGLYHITYTYERKRIKHVVFNESWIRDRISHEH